MMGRLLGETQALCVERLGEVDTVLIRKVVNVLPMKWVYAILMENDLYSGGLQKLHLLP